MASFYQAPPILRPELLTTLPTEFRTLGSSEHSINQKRGRLLDCFLEGPLIRGNTFYVTDIPYGRVFAIDLRTKEWSLVVQYDGEPNGLAWHEQRQQIIIADFKCGILAVSIDDTGKGSKPEVILDRFNGERLKGPNDLVITTDGTIIFTDQGMSGLQDPSGRVYRLLPDGKVDVLLRNRPSPNGLVLDASGTTLFVAMTRDNSVWLAPLYPDGSVQRTGKFSSYFGVGGPDGMAMDEEGNLFVAHSTLGAIFVHNKNGTPRARVTSEPWGSGTTNLTWGGQDNRTIYIVETQVYGDVNLSITNSGTLATDRLNPSSAWKTLQRTEKLIRGNAIIGRHSAARVTLYDNIPLLQLTGWPGWVGVGGVGLLVVVVGGLPSPPELDTPTQ